MPLTPDMQKIVEGIDESLAYAGSMDHDTFVLTLRSVRRQLLEAAATRDGEDAAAKAFTERYRAQLQGTPAVRTTQRGGTPAPPHGLPSWGESQLRVENSDFVAKRKAEGGYGEEPGGLYANDLHRFIYEYDDADPHKSAWFMHRLELALKAATPQAQEGMVDWRWHYRFVTMMRAMDSGLLRTDAERFADADVAALERAAAPEGKANG
jgi:hypothetical protein